MNFRVQRALESWTALCDSLPQLNEEDVLACLELESATRRRKTVIDRLISRAVRINELRYATNLKEKYYGTSQVCDSHPG